MRIDKKRQWLDRNTSISKVYGRAEIYFKYHIEHYISMKTGRTGNETLAESDNDNAIERYGWELKGFMEKKESMNRRRNKLICAIGVLIVFLGLIMIKIHTKYVFYTTYCKNYYSVIAHTWRYYEYDQIIEVNGEPDKIINEKNSGGNNIIELEYDDGRLFAFVEHENGNRSLCRTEVTDPEYRFGRKKNRSWHR